MKPASQPLDDIAADEWDALVRGSPDGWVFSLHGWQRIVTGVADWGFVERGFGLREGRRLVAVVPLHFRPTHGVMASSGWGGSGPVIAGGLTKTHRERLFDAALDHALALSEEDGATNLDMSCWPVTTASLGNRWSVNPFALRGYEDQSLLSQVIDLSGGEAALWAGLSQSARQAVRKAREAGYRAVRVDWLENLETYYAAHVETYRRTGVSPHPRAYFEGIARLTAPAGASVLFAAVDPQGRPKAFHNDARLLPGATYHTGCSFSDARDLGLDYLLMWEALRDAAAEGYGWYDCGWIFPGASDGKQRGLTLFKTRFGGEPHRAFRARRQVEPARPSNPEPEPEPAPVGQSADERPTTAQRRLGLVRRLTRRLRFD